MKLVTKQGIDCLNVLQSGRPYRCDSSKSFWRDDFAKAYDWMANEMRKRIGEPPKGTRWPIWAWYRYDWKDGCGEPIDWWEDEELRPENLGEYEWIPSVELILEAPKHAVLLSDEDNWNAVLSPYPASDPNDVLLSDEEFEAKLDAEFDAVDWSDENRRFEQCRSTFDRIFDVRPLQSASGKQWNGRNVQACFWEIEPKWITSYRTYLEPVYPGTDRAVV